MADCELIPRCPFFNGKMREMPAIVVMYKESYCKTDNSQCARYMVFSALGKEKVPSTLYPNMTDTAKTIIAGAQVTGQPADATCPQAEAI